MASFGQPPAFGGSTPFGAQSQPLGGLFGAQQQNSASLFGGVTSGGLFGSSTPSTGLFGAASSGGSLFGASSASPFGGFGSTASTASLFGAAPQSTGGIFGTQSTYSGLFGGQQQKAGLFGSQTSGAGGQQFTGGLFAKPTGGPLGGQSADGGGLFGTQVSSGALFGGQSTGTGLFRGQQSGGGLFGGQQSGGGLFGGQQPGGGLFGGQQSGGGLVPWTQPPPFGAGGALNAQQSQHGQQNIQMAKNGKFLRHSTPFEQLPDQIQHFVKATHEKIRQMRNEGAVLATAMDEAEAVIEYRELHEDLQRLRQSIAVAEASFAAEVAAADGFRSQVLEVVQGTEDTMWQLKINAARRAVARAHGPEKQHEQLAVHRELLCQPTQSPVPYLSTAIDAMLQQLATLQATRRNLESIVPLDGRANGSPAPAASLQNLPEVLRGLNDYFLHIAAHVARLRDTAASMRADFLRARAATGNFFDPFKDADQREAELAAAKKSNSSPMQLDTGATVAPPVALQPASVPAQAEPLALPAPSGAGLPQQSRQQWAPSSGGGGSGSLAKGKRRTGF